MAIQIRKNLQEKLLNSLRKDRQPVVVFLTNGFQLKGIITGFDSFVVVLLTDGKQQIIYKHAVSTVVPSKPVELHYEEENAEEGEAPEVRRVTIT